jgi:hypothetical protein
LMFWAWFQLLTCHCEIPYRMWVLVNVLSLISVANMPLWNCIQRVSASWCSELDFDCWHTNVASHSESECRLIFWAWFQLLTCHCGFLSRE